MTDDTNGQLKLILDRIERNRADLKEIKTEMVRRVDLDELRGQFVMRSTDHEDRIRCLERQGNRTEERQKLHTSALVILQVILATIAGWFGAQK